MIKSYEHPLPVLETDIDSLDIHTKGVATGSFEVRNAGGGELQGRIISRHAGLSFSPTQWLGNSATIEYKFNASEAGMQVGDQLAAHFYITGVGGEKRIPISARYLKMSITTPEGHTIGSVQDFYHYSRSHHARAISMFTDSEFHMLLIATGYPYVRIYNELARDPHKERALDNFFVLSGLKGRTSLAVSGARQAFTARQSDDTPIHGSFTVKKSDDGFAEAAISSDAPWLTTNTGHLRIADFDGTGTAAVNFTIEPSQIPDSHAAADIRVGQTRVHVSFRRHAPVIFKLSKPTARFEDSGSIEIVNNRGKELHVSAFCADSFVRPSAGINVNTTGSLPFIVKLSALQNAQRFFRRLPLMQTVIELTATADDFTVKKNIPLTVGDWA